MTLPPLPPNAALRWAVTEPLVAEVAPRSILEVGCGQGGFGARLATMATYTGLEPDARSCAVAEARIAPLGGTVRCAHIEEVPAERQFDLLCAFEVLEHLDDDAGLLRDWVSRVRPGGAVIVSVPAWPERFGAWDGAVGHLRRYRPEQLAALLEAAGLGSIATRCYGWPLGYALEGVRNQIARRRGLGGQPDGEQWTPAPARGAHRASRRDRRGALHRAPTSPALARHRTRRHWRPARGLRRTTARGAGDGTIEAQPGCPGAEEARTVAHSPLTPMATLRWAVTEPLVAEVAPRSILEVGCGQGGFGARLATMATYTGLEPDARSCAVAEARIAPLGGTVRCAHIEEVPAEGQFDLLCAFEVLEHLDDDAGLLRDWVSRVRPGGAVIVSVPAWPERFGPMDTMVGHFRRYTPASLTATLRAAGCVEVETTCYGWPLGFALEAGRNRIAARRGASTSTASMEDRSAGSGRLFQPTELLGHLVSVGVAPFSWLQRYRPQEGTGLVAVGRLAGAVSSADAGG